MHLQMRHSAVVLQMLLLYLACCAAERKGKKIQNLELSWCISAWEENKGKHCIKKRISQSVRVCMCVCQCV